MPTPEIDASVPVPAKVGATAETKKPLVTLAELADPDSLETKVAEHEALPKWRVEQEQQRAKREQEVSEKIASSQSNGDVLQVFEAELAKPQNNDRAFNERARGVADESEELLSMEAIAAPKPGRCSRRRPHRRSRSPTLAVQLRRRSRLHRSARPHQRSRLHQLPTPAHDVAPTSARRANACG